MKDLIRKLHANTEKISAERKFDLDLLVQAMYELHKNCGEISVNVICTHNSRRSQVAQLWFIMAAHHFDVPCLKAYSGGTEVTAFNDRMVLKNLHINFFLRLMTTLSIPLRNISP